MFGLSEGCIRDLSRAALVDTIAGEPHPAGEKAAEGLRLFSVLLKKFDVKLVPVSRPGCPVYFCTGILWKQASPSSCRGAQRQSFPGGGQGTNAIDAALGCLGELSERLSLCSMGEDDPRVSDFSSGLAGFDLRELLGFSVMQADKISQKKQTTEAIKTGTDAALNVPTKRQISITNRSSGVTVQIPSYLVLFDEFHLGSGVYSGSASSVGCAVWVDHVGARERAYLELVERDSVAQAWYNRLGIKLVRREDLSNFLPKKMIDHLDNSVRHWVVLSVATDLDAHVMIALSYNEGGKWTAFGSSAGWSAGDAINSAIEEMLQAENSLLMMDAAYPVSDTDAVSRSRVPSQLCYARSHSIIEDLRLTDIAHESKKELDKTYSYEGLLDIINEKRLRIWEFDATRPDIKVPCIKLLSPDLCTWEPRFGKARLFDGVVERGLRSHPASEAEFAARPFPF
ncbi:MAG: YcaO-like family protein [Roseibium sp.]